MFPFCHAEPDKPAPACIKPGGIQLVVHGSRCLPRTRYGVRRDDVWTPAFAKYDQHEVAMLPSGGKRDVYVLKGSIWKQP